MSGICGIVTFGDSEPEPAELEAVLEPLKRRGRDGSQLWAGKGVALGHALLATTPEALAEKLPLHHGESGCAISADARLDDRAGLIAKLGTVHSSHSVGDGELTLLAYLKWGEECVDHLLGDFVFAIWDQRSSRLFCARDPMGMRQLAYAHLPGRAFIFATEAEAVLRHPLVPKDLNLGRIADFLDDLEGFDLTGTFYSAVSRLPAAHSLALTPEGLRLRKFWQLRTPPQLKLRSDDEYVEAFLDVFRAATKSRLRSTGKVGAMLSGGMDSSSAAAVAAELLAAEGKGPLMTFSAVGPDPAACPETRAIYAASRIEGIEPHFVSLAELEPYRDELFQLGREQAEPFDGQMTLVRVLYLAAHRAGLKVILDGVAGDLVLGSDTHIARLLRRGSLLEAWREARGESEIWGEHWPAWKAFGIGAARAWVPRSLRAARRRLAWSWGDRQIGKRGLIAGDFAAQTKLRQRRWALRERDSLFDRLDLEERARRIEHANLVVGRERYDRVAAAVAIEPRDPFMDLRVIDFCLSLPWQQLQGNGWPKILLRRAMAGRLPDELRWRKGKEHLGSAFTTEVFGRQAALVVESENSRETIGRYIDLIRFGGDPPSASEAEHCKERLDALFLYYWLDRAMRRQSC